MTFVRPCYCFLIPFLFCLSSVARVNNVVMIVTDEENQIPKGWEDVMAPWYEENLPAHQWFKNNGMNFKNHHVAATACTPSRGVLYLGQYSHVSGLSQTGGLAKVSGDQGLTFLPPYRTPTIGNWLLASGFSQQNIAYFGKFHLADLDIKDELGESIPTLDMAGNPIHENLIRYFNEHRLAPYGFARYWAGPEPHGPRIDRSGSHVDPFYVDQVLQYLELKKQEYLKGNPTPFFLTLNLVNPHDIVLAIGLWLHNLLPEDLNTIPVPPDLFNKGIEDDFVDFVGEHQVHKDYRKIYRNMYSDDALVTEFYKSKEKRDLIVRLYYSLIKTADNQMMRVINAIQEAPFFNDTYVIFTSDHGDLLGRTGWQKWHTLRSEVTHVPFYVAHPSFSNLSDEEKNVDALTSHVDIVPTILGLMDVDQKSTEQKLLARFSQVYQLPGRDLSPVIFQKEKMFLARPIYLRTDDEITKGENLTAKLSGFQANIPAHLVKDKSTLLNQVDSEFLVKTIGESFFQSIEGQTHLESVRNFYDGCQWVLVRYFSPDDESDESFRLYNINDDPLEVTDLSGSQKKIFAFMLATLNEMREHYFFPIKVEPEIRAKL